MKTPMLLKLTALSLVGSSSVCEDEKQQKILIRIRRKLEIMYRNRNRMPYHAYGKTYCIRGFRSKDEEKKRATPSAPTVIKPVKTGIDVDTGMSF
jgi:hypothetical protein